ncbi:unnamed protein product [Prunus armeniaca]
MSPPVTTMRDGGAITIFAYVKELTLIVNKTCVLSLSLKGSHVFCKSTSTGAHLPGQKGVQAWNKPPSNERQSGQKWALFTQASPKTRIA